jgi:hypothetical protein
LDATSSSLSSTQAELKLSQAFAEKARQKFSEQVKKCEKERTEKKKLQVVVSEYAKLVRGLEKKLKKRGVTSIGNEEELSSGSAISSPKLSMQLAPDVNSGGHNVLGTSPLNSPLAMTFDSNQLDLTNSSHSPIPSPAPSPVISEIPLNTPTSSSPINSRPPSSESESRTLTSSKTTSNAARHNSSNQEGIDSINLRVEFETLRLKYESDKSIFDSERVRFNKNLRDLEEFSREREVRNSIVGKWMEAAQESQNFLQDGIDQLKLRHLLTVTNLTQQIDLVQRRGIEKQVRGFMIPFSVYE